MPLITRTRKTSWLLEIVDKELASTNRKHKKLDLLITKWRGAFACALACVRKNFLVNLEIVLASARRKTKISNKK